MTQTQGMILFVLGLIATGFGVGGVEHSLTNGELMLATLVAAVGLTVMMFAAERIKSAE